MGVSEFRQRWSGWAYGLLAAVPGHSESMPTSPETHDVSRVADRMRWRPVPNEADQWGLFDGERQIGTWRGDTRAYWRLNGRDSFAPTPEVAPIQPPGGAAWPATLENGVLNFGLQKSLLRESHGITRSGAATTAADILAAIGGEMVPASPAKPAGGGAIDWAAVYGGVPLWLLVCLGATVLFLLLRKGSK